MQRKDTRGVRARRTEAQANGRKLAPKLKAGSVVAVQDRLNQSTSYPYQLGVVVDAGDGSCVVTAVDSRRTINGTCFDKGDFAIFVKWCVAVPPCSVVWSLVGWCIAGCTD